MDPRGAAAIAGLSVGDHVLEIDGVDTGALSAVDVARAFSAAYNRPAWVRYITSLAYLNESSKPKRWMV